MKYVLITGASSGIGFELAKVFARKGYNLVIVARSYDRLINLKYFILNSFNSNLIIDIISIDLSEDDSAYKLYKIVKDKGIDIDILVNNAGVGIYGEFKNYSRVKIFENDKMIDLNIKSHVKLTKFFLDDMLSRSRGKILNVSSIAAFQSGPLMGSYYASKAFILSFSEALREELRNTGIGISVLCPGPTLTEFEKSSNLNKAGLFYKLNVMSAQKVAEIAYKDLLKGKRIIIPGFLNKLSVFCVRFLPRVLTVKIARILQERKNRIE